jgi:hypothetical protein
VTVTQWNAPDATLVLVNEAGGSIEDIPTIFGIRTKPDSVRPACPFLQAIAKKWPIVTLDVKQAIHDLIMACT